MEIEREQESVSLKSIEAYGLRQAKSRSSGAFEQVSSRYANVPSTSNGGRPQAVYNSFLRIFLSQFFLKLPYAP